MITLAQLPVGHPGRALLTGHTPWFAYQGDPRFSHGLIPPQREPPPPRSSSASSSDRSLAGETAARSPLKIFFSERALAPHPPPAAPGPGAGPKIMEFEF